MLVSTILLNNLVLTLQISCRNINQSQHDSHINHKNLYYTLACVLACALAHVHACIMQVACNIWTTHM